MDVFCMAAMARGAEERSEAARLLEVLKCSGAQGAQEAWSCRDEAGMLMPVIPLFFHPGERPDPGFLSIQFQPLKDPMSSYNIVRLPHCIVFSFSWC
jgi:hypothetical protein